MIVIVSHIYVGNMMKLLLTVILHRYNNTLFKRHCAILRLVNLEQTSKGMTTR